jgi:acyl-CoA synthetase (AMP-forming)/AMP-acid ligase II
MSPPTTFRTLRAEELRDFLKSKVPEHMVPSLFFVLDALPLTSNGKVDRSRLLQLQTPGRPWRNRTIACGNAARIDAVGHLCRSAAECRE